jgi:hypothetical protein
MFAIRNGKSETLWHMKEQLLNQWQELKSRKATWPPTGIKQDFMDCISFGEQLIELGCEQDRDGVSIAERVRSATVELKRIQGMERQRGN